MTTQRTETPPKAGNTEFGGASVIRGRIVHWGGTGYESSAKWVIPLEVPKMDYKDTTGHYVHRLREYMLEAIGISGARLK